ncbi:GntR family transcriptional regulator [Mesorhizobium sp. NZP2077]|uniref:GntR family transcriptional regulator n=1 Tax=Mesorhizobium sp. NZP2077 TaxID=2483404 RepID=UPI001554E8E8|nr:GntR family transcriptional regulator [Mesorhizobium sp. NZP2077]QKC86721.1 GntR family transcriptional regulator [Mesorhizobium sp. NZP2077]QKD20416.1 GntR family transcriptional regulator [Mesorhizobium sp. NZP2077]
MTRHSPLLPTNEITLTPPEDQEGGLEGDRQITGKMSKQDIYLELRRRICLLDYQPGSRLNERELASEFGVSRTPLRTVLQRLEYDGLIVSQHGNGTEVTSIDLSSMRDIYIVRMRLMDAMAESSPLPVTDDNLREIQDLELACRQLLDTKDKRQFAEIIIRLHRILHSLSSNGPLRDFNDILFFQSARFWFLLLEKMDFRQQVEDLLDELRMIRRTLELRDVRLVATVHKSHLAMVLSRLDAMEAADADRFVF